MLTDNLNHKSRRGHNRNFSADSGGYGSGRMACSDGSMGSGDMQGMTDSDQIEE